jgi:excisionase family DNA binding protein
MRLMETQSIATPVMPRLAYSIAESEALIGLSRSTIYRMIEAGTLNTVLHGRRRLVPARELERILSTAAPAP